MQPTAPLLAYLKALRGRITPASGPLGAQRVKAFGLPYKLPADNSADGPDQRAENFLESLHAVVGSLDSREREVAFQYFFGSGGVEERHQATTDSLSDSSSSTARNYQASALEKVAAGLLEFGEGRHGEGGHQDMLGELVEVIAPSYPPGLGLEQLAHLILPSRPVIDAAEVTIELTDADDPHLYNLQLTSTISARPGRLYMALTPRATLSDLVVTMCPQVAEVFTCSSREDVQERAAEWAEADRRLLTAVGKNAKGLTIREPLSLVGASKQEKKAIFKGLPASDIETMALLSADVPNISPNHELIPVEVELPSLMRRGDQYCYWFADRPTFVRRIVIEWSDFTLPEEKAVRLLSTIRTTAYEPSYSKKRCVYNIDGWLVAGQGVVVTWG
jgi:hypothetical protein